eukprot:7529273-Karenia_brevis.AAC.1
MGGTLCSDCMSSVDVDCLCSLLPRNEKRLKGAGGGSSDSSTFETSVMEERTTLSQWERETLSLSPTLTFVKSDGEPTNIRLMQ